MSNVVEKIHLVKADPEKNNNKFWCGTLYYNDDVLCEWGRVGDKGQSKMFPGKGRSFLEKKVKDKKRAGRNDEIAYREIDIVNEVSVSSPRRSKDVTCSNLASIAKKQIKSKNQSPEMADLIDYLVKTNAHNIAQATNNAVTFNYDTGQFQTSMGLIGQNSIDQARTVLSDIANLVSNKKMGNGLLEKTRDFFMLVPTDLGRKRLDHAMFWGSPSQVQKQNAILDGLQSSLVQATTTKGSKPNTKQAEVEEQVFDTELELVTDRSTTQLLTGYFNKTKSSVHSCYHYKPKKIWSVNIKSMVDAFVKDGAKMKNVVEGWHGSGAGNVLSLLKTGMLVRPPSNAAVSGALFGSGIYTAPLRRTPGKSRELVVGSSTKALGYSTGFWAGRSSQRTFMFVVDIAMGKFYIPEKDTYMKTKYPVKGYDSTWAHGNYRGSHKYSGVMNDETIVYRASQVNIKYLIEFE